MSGFCQDCPDHEACATGWSCEKVREAQSQTSGRLMIPDEIRFYEINQLPPVCDHIVFRDECTSCVQRQIRKQRDMMFQAALVEAMTRRIDDEEDEAG